jgi:hypothetical protein
MEARVRIDGTASRPKFYRKSIKNNKMVGPEGLNGAAQAFDLPIMRSSERTELLL